MGLVAVVSAALVITGCEGVEDHRASDASESPTASATLRDRARAAEPGIAPASPSPRKAPATTRLPSSNAPADPSGSHSGPTSGPAGTSSPTDSGAGSAGASPNPSGSAEGEPQDSLERGHEGPRVRALQRTLNRLHYDPGAVDGVFGSSTQYAVWAFQKVNGLNPDGVVGPKTRRALDDPRLPEPLVPGGDADRVEIDLTRQLLYVYEGDRLALTSHISSGSEEPYCTGDGHCGDAVTPTGDYDTTWRVHGWRTSDLGRLYNPVYFVGGVAVHGYPSVPLYPASHGCVRIPMHTAETFPELVGDGEAVYVRSP